ncbi:MAG: hypothetical protein EA384_15835 [Spirochaetaceae bacterium]|nr:MAG: hypothetical protein EA384_15835 [Spirochaetaceae bacterium]
MRRERAIVRPMIMNTWQRDTVVRLLLDAGRTALSYFGDPGISIKADKSIVTEADKAIERDLARSFDHPEDGVYLLGEETFETHSADYFDRALKHTTWIVDPIDGTSSFAFGLPTWGVSIAYSEQGTIREGGILLPVSGDLMITDNGTVFYTRLSGAPEQWNASGLKPYLPPKLDPKRIGLVSISQEVAKQGYYHGPQSVQSNGSCVYSAVYLVLGSFIGYIANVKLWDIAAAMAFFDALRFSMKFADGRTVGPHIIADHYFLSSTHTRRWRMTDQFYIADSEPLCDYLISRTELPRTT